MYHPRLVMGQVPLQEKWQGRDTVSFIGEKDTT